jgi:hypothetical protein
VEIEELDKKLIANVPFDALTDIGAPKEVISPLVQSRSISTCPAAGSSATPTARCQPSKSKAAGSTEPDADPGPPRSVGLPSRLASFLRQTGQEVAQSNLTSDCRGVLGFVSFFLKPRRERLAVAANLPTPRLRSAVPGPSRTYDHRVSGSFGQPIVRQKFRGPESMLKVVPS